MTSLPDAMVAIDQRVDEIQIQLADLCRSSIEARGKTPIEVAIELEVLPSHMNRMCDSQGALRLYFTQAIDLALKLGFDLELQISASRSGLAVFHGSPLRRSKFASSRMMMTELRTEAFGALNEILRRAGREVSDVIEDLRSIDGSASATGTASKTQPSAEIAMAYLTACGLDIDLVARTYETESAVTPALIEAPVLSQMSPSFTRPSSPATQSGSVSLKFRTEDAPQDRQETPKVDQAKAAADMEAARAQIDQSFATAQRQMAEVFRQHLTSRNITPEKAAKKAKEELPVIEQMLTERGLSRLSFARCLDICMSVGIDIEFQPLVLHRGRPLDTGSPLRRSGFPSGKDMMQQARVECGQALREYLEVTGLTGSLYAEQLGIAASTVSSMVSPKSSKSVAIQKLLAALKVKGCKVQLGVLPHVLEDQVRPRK